MATTAVQKLLIWILAAVVMTAFGPTISGYAWAIGVLPVYGAACHFDKIFGSAISLEGYRIFLLKRGCDVDGAIRDIVTASGLPVDPTKIVAIYHETQRPESSDEYLEMESVRRSLRSFAASAADKNNCLPDENCTVPYISPESSIENTASAYLVDARSRFLDAMNDGADYMSWLLRKGPIVQSALFVFYAIATLAAGKLGLDCVAGRYRRLRLKKGDL